jgi:hypothetical protein
MARRRQHLVAAEQFAIGLDRFSCLTMQTALRALAYDPGLWSRFSDGESLLFHRSDFLDPSGSRLFAALKASSKRSGRAPLAEMVGGLEAACHGTADVALSFDAPGVSERRLRRHLVARRPRARPLRRVRPLPGFATRFRIAPLSSRSVGSRLRTAAGSVRLVRRPAYTGSTPAELERNHVRYYHRFQTIARNVSISIMTQWLLSSLLGWNMHLPPIWLSIRFIVTVIVAGFTSFVSGYLFWPRRRTRKWFTTQVEQSPALVAQISVRRPDLAPSPADAPPDWSKFLDCAQQVIDAGELSQPPWYLSSDAAETLRAQRVENAFDLKARLDDLALSSEDHAIVRRWLDATEQRAAEVYYWPARRKQLLAARAALGDCSPWAILRFSSAGSVLRRVLRNRSERMSGNPGSRSPAYFRSGR